MARQKHEKLKKSCVDISGKFECLTDVLNLLNSNLKWTYGNSALDIAFRFKQ